jgi:hypothetical protein
MAAEDQRSEGVGEGTKSKETRVWKRWCEYCSIIQNDNDIYLQGCSPEFRTRLFGAFAAALRRRQFSAPNKIPLGAGAIEETMAKLSQIFRANVGYNPAHGSTNGGWHPSLGMKNNDPGQKQQKALPVCVYREIYNRATSSGEPEEITIAWLQVLAFFFCMRSCEYSNVSGKQKTKVVCFRNRRFFQKNRLLKHNSPGIHLTTVVSITFEWQKRDVRDDVITHQKSNDSIGEGIMCPDRACIELVKRIYSEKVPNQSIPDLQINTVIKNGERDVGTHSNRSGGAMGMYLAGTPVYTIMLLGRWSSDAFMRYIRKQVLDMSHRVSAKMITYAEFYTIPDFVHQAADGDLRTRNNYNLATTTTFNGSHMTMRQGTHPAFHLEH